jgi:hypothetical protein
MTIHQHRGAMLCQLCSTPQNEKFYDAQVPKFGQWGNLCESCFVAQGCALGVGRGQEYTRQWPSGSWVKTAG